MKRFLLLLSLVASSLASFAQVQPPPSGAGLTYLASAYGQWMLSTSSAVTATGSQSFLVQPDTVVTANGQTIVPFAVGLPLAIDRGNSNAEAVTITGVANCYPGSISCRVTASFSYTHGQGAPIQSGTYGLQEAINVATFAKTGTVLVDQTWAGPSGSSLITAASGSTAVTIQDNRAGAVTFYGWNGSAYVEVSASGSQKVIYASAIARVTPGVVVVPGSSATGTVDSAGPINMAIASGNVDLEVDSGFALSTSLVLTSNTTIHCTSPQYGFIMQAAANEPVLINAHTNAPTTTNGTGGYLVSNIGDSNIAVIGCQLNANSTQSATGTNNQGTPHSATPGSPPLFIGAAEFYAVNGLWLENDEFYDSASWALFGSNDEQVHILNNYFHQPTPTVAYKYTAGYQFDGPDQFIWAHGNRINAGDDSIAFNADDGNVPGSGDPNSPYVKSFVKWGNETDIHVSDETLDSTYFGVRLLSTNDLIDRVDFTDISGLACGNTGTLEAIYPGVGPGNLGTIRFDGWNVVTSGSCNNYSQTYNFNVSSNIQSLQLDGVQLTNPGVNWPVITQTAGSIGILSLRDWDLNTQNSTFSDVVSTTGGTIGQIAASGLNWYDNSSNTGSFFSGTTVPGILTCSNYAGPNRLLASGYVPAIENGDCFTNTYPTTTTYVNTTFNEASSGTLLAGTTPATCTDGCTGWIAAPGQPETGAWAYSTNSATLTESCSGGGTDNYCPVYVTVTPANYVVRWTLTTLELNFALSPVVKWTNNENFVAFAYSGGVVTLYDVVSGTNNVIATENSWVPTTGDYTLTVNGTTITLAAPDGTLSGTVSGSNTGTGIGFSDNNVDGGDSNVISAFSVESN